MSKNQIALRQELKAVEKVCEDIANLVSEIGESQLQDFAGDELGYECTKKLDDAFYLAMKYRDRLRSLLEE